MVSGTRGLKYWVLGLSGREGLIKANSGLLLGLVWEWEKVGWGFSNGGSTW